MKTNKMKVEIWSDTTCPFCYIGKQNFESALGQFKNASDIEILWKSFELAPGLKTQPKKNMHQWLAEMKGISLQQAINMSDQVAGAAKQVGLEYNFHKTIPANSFNSHRFLHLTKDYHLQDKAKESLFRAYFTDGRNIDDIPTLMALGKEIGLDPDEVKNALEDGWSRDDVNQDILEAKNRGITSVPSFVFNDKLTVTGAQDSAVFLKILEKAYTEWQIQHTGSAPTFTEGQSCTIGENCQ
jgi:predicted DsbA family dithiol-disulfide isomerase